MNCESVKPLCILPPTTAFALKSGTFLPTSTDIFFFLFLISCLFAAN